MLDGQVYRATLTHTSLDSFTPGQAVDPSERVSAGHRARRVKHAAQTRSSNPLLVRFCDFDLGVRQSPTRTPPARSGNSQGPSGSIGTQVSLDLPAVERPASSGLPLLDVIVEGVAPRSLVVSDERVRLLAVAAHDSPLLVRARQTPTPRGRAPLGRLRHVRIPRRSAASFTVPAGCSARRRRRLRPPEMSSGVPGGRQRIDELSANRDVRVRGLTVPDPQLPGCATPIDPRIARARRSQGVAVDGWTSKAVRA